MVHQHDSRANRQVRRPSLLAGVSAAALLAVLSAPSATAFRVDVLDGTVLDTVAAADGEAASFDFVYRFELDRSRSLEFVVVPDRDNPVYLNGTPGSAGWWTDVRVVEEDDLGEGADAEVATTNGSGPVALGYLPDDEPLQLRLRVHVPADALRGAGDVTALFRVQQAESRWALFGEGEPEWQDVPVTITRVEPRETHGPADGAASVPPKWNAPQVALVSGSAIMALGLIALFGGGRR